MTYSIEHLAYSIYSQINGGSANAKERVPIDLIYFQVESISSLLIRDELMKNPKRKQLMNIWICCNQVLCRDIECNGDPSGMSEYYITIPKPISILGSDAISYVGLNDKKTRFKNLGTNGASYNNGNRFTKLVPAYEILNSSNGYEIKLHNFDSNIEYLCVAGIFEPGSINSNTPCFKSSELQLPVDLYHQLEILVLKHFSSVLLRTKDDVVNDNLDQN